MLLVQFSTLLTQIGGSDG